MAGSSGRELMTCTALAVVTVAFHPRALLRDASATGAATTHPLNSNPFPCQERIVRWRSAFRFRLQGLRARLSEATSVIPGLEARAKARALGIARAALP